MAKQFCKGFLLLFFSTFLLARAADSGAPLIVVNGSGASSSLVTVAERATIELSTSFPSGSIFYTTDGSEPSAVSIRYTSSFAITSTTTIRAIAYSADFTSSAQSAPIEVRIVPLVSLEVDGFGRGSFDFFPEPSGADGLSLLYPQGTSVRITATPAEGWSFVRWDGAATATTNVINIGVSGGEQLSGIFGTQLTIANPAHGKIIADHDPGLVPANEPITLTAIPDPGYYLATWGGAASGAAIQLHFNVQSANPTISALFLPIPDGKVILNTLATTGGVVKAFSYRRGGEATNLYDVGVTMMLQATPDYGFAFTGWSGDLTGNDNPALVHLDTSKTITANFAPGATVQVTADGGTIQRDPDLPIYPRGSRVTLSATPSHGFTFDHWYASNGDQISSSNVLSITSLYSSATFTAHFSAAKAPLLWEYQTAYTVAAIDDTGNLYSYNYTNFQNATWSELISIDKSGAPLWSTLNNPGGSPNAPRVERISIDSTGLIRTGLSDQGNVFAAIKTCSPSGVSTGLTKTVSGYYLRSLSVAHDDTLYMVGRATSGTYDIGDTLVTLDPNGAEKWRFSIPVSTNLGIVTNERLSRPAIDAAGRLHFTGSRDSNAVYCLSPSKVLLWRTPITQGNLLDNSQNGLESPGVQTYRDDKYSSISQTILGVDSVLVNDGDGSLVALDYSGTIKWRFQTTDVLSIPSIGADGTILVGARDSTRFYALNPSGSLRWTRNPGFGAYRAPAVGSDGTIYISDQKRLYALNPIGTKLWEATFPQLLPWDVMFGAPIIHGTNVYVPGSSEIYAYSANASGLAESPWPMFEASARATSALNLPFAPLITQSTFAADGLHLKISAQPGAIVRAYQSSDLSSWSEAQSQTTASGQIEMIVSISPTGSSYYRIRQE